MLDLRRRLADIVAIPITPFRDGEIALDEYRAVLDRMLDAGIRVVTPNGNTGEFYALSPAERTLMLETTCDAVGGRALVLAGIGFDVRTAVADGRAAEAAGAGAVMIHQPVHPYVSGRGWVDYHARIAAELPGMGIVPYVKDARIGPEQLAELHAATPNLVGVKYAVPDPVRLARVRGGAPELTWIAGLAEPYAPSAFAHGATGFTSGLVNVHPELSLSLLDALRAGDYAAAMPIGERIAEFEELRAADRSADNVSVIKEALAQLGTGSREVRPPSSPVAAGTAAAVARILGEWGLQAAGEREDARIGA